MARNESIVIQVHPENEQDVMDEMNAFCWEIVTSEKLNALTGNLAVRGVGAIYGEEAPYYIKMVFVRDLNQPHLEEIKKLEKQYSSLTWPKIPKYFPGHYGIWIVASLFYGIGIVAWILYYYLKFKPDKEIYVKKLEQNVYEMHELTGRAKHLSKNETN